MSEGKPFLDTCRAFRKNGHTFLALQTQDDHVSYHFLNQGEVVVLEQPIEDGVVTSIAQIFPLADFAERQMYRDCKVKAIGNINLLPREGKS